MAAVKAPVDALPDRAAAPVKPAVQEQAVALAELQLIVDEPPEAMGLGEALMETVGAVVKLAVTLRA